MGLYQYNPKKHNISCGGLLITGFAEGTFINVEANSDHWNESTGVYGDTIRVRQNDESAIITLTLQYSSPGNAILDNFRKLDLVDGLGAFSFLAKDNTNPLNQHIAGVCYVKRMPTFTGSNDAPAYEWTLVAPELKADIRGALPVLGI